MLHAQAQTQSPQNVTQLATDGFPRGTEVVTLNGTRPVESLHKGDRIITRTGARSLNTITRRENDLYILGFDHPQVIFLRHGQAHSDTGLEFTA